MEGPRAPKPEEFDELVTFLNKSLKHDRQWSVAEEYPTTLTAQNIQNFRIIKDGDKILSHAAVKPLIIKTRRGIIKVGCIGSVVTNEEYRNKGLSSAVLDDCLKLVSDQSCDIAILWTNLFDFYRKLGFELAGSEVSMLIDRPLNLPASNLTIKEGNRVDSQALYRVFSQHSVHTVRTLDDFEKYLRIPNCRLYTAWSPDGRLEGYTVEGKGADLQGYIHEWGGTTEAITQLTNYVHKKTNKLVTLIAPNHAQGLIRKMDSYGVKRIDGFLGMIKIVNRQALFAKVIRSARQEFGIDNFVLEYKDGFYYYGVGQNLLKTDSERDITKLIFGPHKPSQLFDAGPEVNGQLDRALPVELWIWGWDSI